MSDDLRDVLIAFAATGVLGWVAVILRGVVSDIAALARHVLPHFEPAHDEHGRETFEHTLPARVDKLVKENIAVREELREHMRAEEEQYAKDNAHRADREAKVDKMYDMLKDGNIEVRRDTP